MYLPSRMGKCSWRKRSCVSCAVIFFPELGVPELKVARPFVGLTGCLLVNPLQARVDRPLSPLPIPDFRFSYILCGFGFFSWLPFCARRVGFAGGGGGGPWAGRLGELDTLLCTCTLSLDDLSPEHRQPENEFPYLEQITRIYNTVFYTANFNNGSSEPELPSLPIHPPENYSSG